MPFCIRVGVLSATRTRFYFLKSKHGRNGQPHASGAAAAGYHTQPDYSTAHARSPALRGRWRRLRTEGPRGGVRVHPGNSTAAGPRPARAVPGAMQGEDARYLKR